MFSQQQMRNISELQKNIKLTSTNNLYANCNIPQSSNRYSDLRNTNPSVTDMPTYRSRRSYSTSPEHKVKSQRQNREQRYPSSQGFQSILANYIPPFENRGGCNKNNRSKKDNKSNKKT